MSEIKRTGIRLRGDAFATAVGEPIDLVLERVRVAVNGLDDFVGFPRAEHRDDSGAIFFLVTEIVAVQALPSFEVPA